MQRDAWTVTGMGLLALAAVLLVFGVPGIRGEAHDVRVALAEVLILLALIGAGFVIGTHRGTGAFLRQVLVWAAIGLSLAVMTSHRIVMAALLPVGQSSARAPSTPEDHAPGVISVRAASNGHFIVDALVNGTHVAFLVDTGATDVALTRADAQRIGIDIEALDYSLPVVTANGQSLFALTEIDEIAIGTIRVHGIRAAVFQGDFSYSILGMSFLKRLSSFTVDSDRLVMRQ